MRNLLALGALLGLLALVTSAQAQRPPFSGYGGSMFLLMNKGVQDELKITEEQQTKLPEKMKSVYEKFQAANTKLKDVPEADRQEKAPKLMKEAEAAAFKELGEVLQPEQLKRFKQIQRQHNVALTLINDEEADKALAITAEQKEKAKAVQEETQTELGQIYGQINKDNRREMQAKIMAAQKEANDHALKVLTDDQRKKWKDLVGEPFEVKMDGFMRKKKE